MEQSFVTNISGCIESATDLMHGNLSLVYYSHIPVAIIALLIGFFVIRNNRKDISAKVMFLLSLVFTGWVVSSLFSWVSSNSSMVSFFWSLFGVLNSLLFLSCFYLMYTYKRNKDIPVSFKYIIGVLFLPILFMTPTNMNVGDFNHTYCYPEDNLFLGYAFYFQALVALFTLVMAIKRYRESSSVKKHEIVLISLAIVLFIASIFGTAYVSDKFQRYDIEVYGVFAMPLFLGFLAYLIVRFKAFDIKLIGAQALVWALIILIGSQFFFIQNNVNRVLTAITLVISAIVGLMIIRSVKKEVAQREELAVANENQQLLIRFITHQVKGFFTKSKMVFASLLEGDFGQIPEAVTPVLKEGLESDNKAVEMVQEVLKASSLRSGTMTYNFEETDLKEFVGGIADTFKDTAAAKGLAYEINLPAEKILSKIDRLQLTQVIKNLIDNSVKYTLNGFVRVNLKIRSSGDGRRNIKTALFSVEDSGVGLSDGDKAKLFKEGGRGEESVKVNVNSTGYGLFIVKKIVEGHGGKIWAESRGRGHGSRFYVELPLVESARI